jgi:hypothetical protein
MANGGALGDRLVDIAIFTLMGGLGLGWALLLGTMGVQALFPQSAARAERVLQATSKWLNPTLKYALWVVLALVAVRFVASLLGWAPPVPPGDPGELERGS